MSLRRKWTKKYKMPLPASPQERFFRDALTPTSPLGELGGLRMI
jgi:hypothetical protein